ncbi:carbohydrate kinase family protein [Foetidibacter luteolus]|uniref:carbohydrate kinase family protein n=1 Tax=Foetidibacter luteolus TaxID=2608880 RepID=UPI00129A286E|nr:carbohydrate kinase [Foetidibacter luteolus]
MQENEHQHPVVCFGETLWDILPAGKMPGGAPMNVAYHLNKLGKNPAIISRIGLDDLGKELVQAFENRGMNTDYFQADDEKSTGKVYAEIRENNEVHYDIVKPVAWDFIAWDDSFTSLLSGARYFVFGSLATRCKQSRQTLLQCLDEAPVKVLDINLRPPHYNKKIVEELLKRADILKMNLAELHLITGWFSNYKNDEERISLLAERFALDTLLVTKGGDGAVLLYNGSFYNHPGYKVEVVDTVGSGDAFLAGFLSSVIDGALPDDALDFASRMGAYVASCRGGCPEYSLSNLSQVFITETNNHNN